jgi:hypothetical protein
MKAVRRHPNGTDIEMSADRQLLIAYLEYAVSDVAAVDEISASLLQLAIAHLKATGRGESPLRFAGGLC